jgi:hypothetical protein
VGLLGQGLSGSARVKFNWASASFAVVSDTYLTAKIPSGQTGIVTISTPFRDNLEQQAISGNAPIMGLTPRGKVGSSVVVAGSGLIRAATIAVGGVKVTAFTANSDKQVTFTSSAALTVTP